jgi:hypothetical protein
MQYAEWTDSGVATWSNGTANINYYDNVLAFYVMYYRTGIDLYLQYARWLADRWWTNPAVLDRGNCHDGQQGWCTMPRIAALSGMFLRAIDQDLQAGIPNSSPMWAGLRNYIDLGFAFMMNVQTTNNNALGGDIREMGYNDMFVAMCGAYDPDPVHAATCRSAVNAAILTTIEPQRLPDGHWEGVVGTVNSQGFVYDTNAQGPGTVTVTPGSNVVTLVGGTWNPAWFPAEFFSAYSPADISTRDSTYYNATYVDSTHLQLDRNYVDVCSSGTNSCSGRQWLLGPPATWIGFGAMGYMEGILGHFFNQAHIALNMDPQYASTAALAKSYVVDAANWISKSTLDGSGSVDPATRGALYSAGYGVCTPGNDTLGCRCGPNNPNCVNAVASRENMMEALGELGLAYGYDPSPSLRSAIDNVFSAAFAKNPTDPGYDGTYASDLDSFFYGTYNPKWFGFIGGMGGSYVYLSTRQGGLAQPVFEVIYVDGDIASVPGAAKMQVAVTEPSGSVDPPVTCSKSPCPVTVNRTLGNWALQVSYLSSSNAVVSSGQPFIVVVQ